MRRRAPRTAAAALLLAALAAAQRTRSSPRDLTGYLPADTPLVLDLHGGAACARALVDLLQPLPPALPPRARFALQVLPLLVRGATGLFPEDLLDVLAPGHVALARWPARARAGSWVVLSRVADARAARRVLQRAGDRIAFSIDDGVLTLAATPAEVDAALAFRRTGAPSLLGRRAYTGGRAALPLGRGVRVYVDLEAVRRARGETWAWDGLDAGGRLLVGPWAHALERAHRLDVSLEITARGARRGLALRGRLDASPLDADPRGVAALLPHGAAPRPLPPWPAGTIACVALDRDAGAFLCRAGDYLGAEGALGARRFTTIADTLLVGPSLVDDVLPVLAPPALLAFPAEPEPLERTPRIRLPAFAAVAGMRAGARGIAPVLRRALGTLAMAANDGRGRAKRPLYYVRREGAGDRRVDAMRLRDWRGPGMPPLEHGFAPALAFPFGHAVLASTRDGARRVVDALGRAGEARLVSGDFVMLDGAGLAAVLRDNLGALVLDRVLKEGETPRAARAFWETAAAVSACLALELEVVPGAGETTIRLWLGRIDEAAEDAR